MKLLYLVILIGICNLASAQFVHKDTIRFSGVVFDENYKPLPETHIIINNKTGTFTNDGGYFNIMVNVHDSLTFSFIGYQSYTFVIPDTLTQLNYVSGIFLKKDVFKLAEVIVFPYLNRAELRAAMIRGKNLSDDEINAKSNLSNVIVPSSSKYTYMQGEGIRVQQKQFIHKVEYMGLVSPDQMVGVNFVGIISTLANFIKPNKSPRKEEQHITKLILEHKRNQNKKKINPQNN